MTWGSAQSAVMMTMSVHDHSGFSREMELFLLYKIRSRGIEDCVVVMGDEVG